MASPIGHALVGIGLAVAVARVADTPTSPILWLGAVIASGIPDLDLIGSIFGLSIRRAHRCATHSLLILGGLILAVAWGWSLLPGDVEPGLGLAWSAALLSHPVLDVMTTGPRVAAQGFGIPLLWPVFSRRWYAQHPIFDPPQLNTYLSAGKVGKALLPEIYCLGPVSIILILLGHLF